METMGNRIMKNRKRLGLTQDQLAEKLGVTAQAVSKWENDQSYPDISVIPQLADIFGITTDALLGRETEQKVHEAEVVQEMKGDCGKSRLAFYMDSGRKATLCFAVWVVSVGGVYLASTLCSWELSFWSILWTTALTVFGLFGLYPRFSFFRLGCLLVGAYSLAARLFLPDFSLSGGVFLAGTILLFGLSLLCDVLKKPLKPAFRATYTDRSGTIHTGKRSSSYESTEKSFCFEGSFGSDRQRVELPVMAYGDISASFGEFIVDLSGVQSLTPNARLEANCSFGNLTILVPGSYQVKIDQSVAFGSVSIVGEPGDVISGELILEASANFGEITLRYI